MRTDAGLGFQIVMAESDAPLTEYPHFGNTYVCGTANQEYKLRLINRTCNRMLVVPSVDGLSVMDGQIASTKGRGYILAPWEVTTIPGWRLDNDNIAKFVFGRPLDSYAAKFGKNLEQNIGVIGAAFFKEKVKPLQHHFYDWNQYKGVPLSGGFGTIGATYTASHSIRPSDEGKLAQMDCCMTENTSSASLGTSFGPKTEHHVHTVEFDREAEPMWTAAFYYHDAATLQKMGIPVYARTPNPFPGDPVSGGCTPPSDWRG